MKFRLCKGLISALCLMIAASVGAQAKGANEKAQKAAKVFQQIMDTPDKGVPAAIFEKAHCVAVFPDVLKAGFIIGGRGGSGVASCRTGAGWSAPVFLDLGGGSIGLQIGAQSTDFVLLFMGEEGLKSLLKSKFEMGGDASVAAGPVGREVGAATDLRLNAQILSYSRSKGLFAGLELKGSVITLDKSDMKDVYGAEATPEEVLRGKKPGTAAVKVYPTTLARYSGHKK